MSAPPFAAGGAHVRVTEGTAAASVTDAVVCVARTTGVTDRDIASAVAMATSGVDRSMRIALGVMGIIRPLRVVSTDMWIELHRFDIG